MNKYTNNNNKCYAKTSVGELDSDLKVNLNGLPKKCHSIQV